MLSFFLFSLFLPLLDVWGRKRRGSKGGDELGYWGMSKRVGDGSLGIGV